MKGVKKICAQQQTWRRRSKSTKKHKNTALEPHTNHICKHDKGSTDHSYIRQCFIFVCKEYFKSMCRGKWNWFLLSTNKAWQIIN
jgi:hypothetical protein